MSDDALMFMEALAQGMPDDERLITCGFRGDPTGDDSPETRLRRFRPRPWRPGQALTLHAECNGYICISSSRQSPDGTWRRKRENFAAGRAVMVDDVGTKLPQGAIHVLPPTAMIETSPANFQAWYFLAKPCREVQTITDLIEAFIRVQLLGADSGMAGFNRVGRLPGYINGKAKYGGGAYPVTMTSWHPDRRYSIGEIAEAFRLDLTPPRRRRGEVLLADTRSDVLEMRVEMFKVYLRWMSLNGMLKQDHANVGGWIDITCPWVGNHTNRADNGSSISVPSEANNFYGGFRCHHEKCRKKGWGALTEFISERANDNNG